MNKHRSEDYKLNAVKYYLKSNKTQKEICKIFDCSERSLMRWVDRYKKSKSIKRNNRKAVSYKVTSKLVSIAKNMLLKDKTMTMNDLLAQLNKKYPDIIISRYHLSRVIKDNNITLKLKRERHEPTTRFRKLINIKKQLEVFYENIRKHKLDGIICIDETSLSTSLKRNRCYSTKGTRCTIRTSTPDVFIKYTGIFAITEKGCLGWKLYKKGGINSERLIDFMKNVVKRKNKLIIMDNASSHRNSQVKYEATKYNKLLYSVPYQPYTNAIENFFSVLKSYLRKTKSSDYNSLTNNIKKIPKNIPTKTYSNIISGAYNRKTDYYSKNKTSKILKKYK